MTEKRAAVGKKTTVKKAAAPKPAKKASSSHTVRSEEIRQLTDTREIRALAHPVRIALLEALTREGPLTATEAAEIVDESPANCSFHFRTLQKYGFVEEAPGGSGRSRPWRRVTLGQSVSHTSGDSSEFSVAAQGFAQLAQGLAFDRLQHYLSTYGTFSKEWQRDSFSTDFLLYLTPDELAEISDGVHEVLMRYRHRTADKAERPEGSQPVQVAAYAFPLPPSASGN